MNADSTANSGFADRQRENTRRLRRWTLGWVTSLALATFGPIFFWNYAAVPSTIAVLINLALGYGMITANKHYILGLDELHRKVHLESLAFSLGIGLIVGLAWSALEIARVVTVKAEIAYLVMIMSLVYVAGTYLGLRKYR